MVADGQSSDMVVDGGGCLDRVCWVGAYMQQGVL